MSKFVRMIKNMSKVQKIITLGASSIVLCGGVAGGVLLYNNANEQAKTDTESYMEELVENVDKMDSHDIRVALDKVTDMDEETREVLEKKLEEKIVAENDSNSDNSSEDNSSENKNEDSSNNNSSSTDSKPSTGNDSKPSTGGGGSSSNSGNSGSSNNNGSSSDKPSKPTEPPKPEKPSYPAKGFDKLITNKFNERMLEQGFAKDDSYTGLPAYTAIKNYALNRTPIPTNKIIHEYWGCKATGKVLTFTDTFKYTDDPAKWSESLTVGKLEQASRNYQCIFANYAVCNSNGDGTFTVTVYTLDMTDL